MRFRFRIGTIMIGVAAVGLGLAAWAEWRRGPRHTPSKVARVVREVLAERSVRLASGRSTADSATVGAFALAAIAASKTLRALGGRRVASDAPGGIVKGGTRRRPM